jgi:hypothetical protein
MQVILAGYSLLFLIGDFVFIKNPRRGGDQVFITVNPNSLLTK